MRLSDAERTDAVNDLAQALGEGRLTMDEFEERTDAVMQATTRRELAEVFMDIPTKASSELKIYSQGEVARAYQSTRKPRLATAMVGSLGLLFGAIASFGALSGVTAALTGTGLLFLIPALWIMLYVAKVGPESWHQPSPRQIERQRMRELKAAGAEERAQMRALEQAQWAERRRQASEITGDAMNLAKRKLEQWNQK
ncbi:hypothetical protein HMPREF2537_04380 [Corynebacterium sp. HMSC074E01]|uniref:Putative membrane protein n=2 Tax=Corynebacteriaceae TaxID=1653 RepID=C3PK31_CORA7|nr:MULTISPECIES: DUF1707 domain-containing protein [Corynebacterium]ACP33932.1 putative membrane protein [Corynebacterium aurimucosum ATCC 700975]OFN78594.1 hypothetical protein HMPREF2537_04380 [Corynebacterium sp. HMSC074E01]OFP66801.1 hypothetical protein HMPREF2978_04005 [Corynebacterium sp. HMSC074C01]QQU94379.1 DUF1707 domain-containing protein [Corynebacterium aurimucosum]